MTRPTNTPPRIYVASLADYNAGRLLGRWIDADQPAEAIHAEIAQMLAESTECVAEEWAIHDYEGFEDLSLSEYADIASVAEVAHLVVEHGPVFAALTSHLGGLSELEEARRYMEEAYQGSFSSVTDYAQDFVEECYSDTLKGLPEFIRYHIDYDGIGWDFEYGGDIFTVEADGQVHVFWSNI